MPRTYKVTELIMNNELPVYNISDEQKKEGKYIEIPEGDKTRYLFLADDKNMTSIKTPEGRELTPEELFDFIIGSNVTDLTRVRDLEGKKADVAIVLGNHTLPVTRERAIKAFELYKRGIVKKIIFTGCVSERDKSIDPMNPKTKQEFMDNKVPKLKWKDIGQGDWGAETFIPSVFKKNYAKQSTILTKSKLREMGVNPEDIISDTMSRSTQENARFAKNAIDVEEIETGFKVKKAIVVSTLTHGARALRIFKKELKDSIELAWCPATLDLEKYESIKEILHAPVFDEDAFRKELKRIYCSTPELIKNLQEEVANHRNAFILGQIDEDVEIPTIDEEREEEIEI